MTDDIWSLLMGPTVGPGRPSDYGIDFLNLSTSRPRYQTRYPVFKTYRTIYCNNNVKLETDPSWTLARVADWFTGDFEITIIDQPELSRMVRDVKKRLYNIHIRVYARKVCVARARNVSSQKHHGPH